LEDYLSEKEQWEAIKAWIGANGLWIVAGIAVGAAALGGWHWYQDHNDRISTLAGEKYEQMLDAFGREDRTRGFVLLGELERDYPSSPYVDQGRLFAARSDVEANSLDKAASELQAVVEHSKDSELALIARLRLARVQISQHKPDLALVTLNGIQPGAFGAQYHEIMGDAYYAKGSKSDALREYLAARSGAALSAPSMPGGAGGSADLGLKIADLTADTKQPAPGVSAPTVNAAAK
jgi:predicted negative regulator of RcsB-dependent stress response